ncbi:MAG: CopG family ribbon-helix-helix protein [Gammaproteobacteria bacterium]
MVSSTPTSETTTVTLRVPLAMKERLEALAKATGRSKSFLGIEALEAYLDVQTWQIEEILKGIEEADAGDFASDAEVNAVFERWTRRAG